MPLGEFIGLVSIKMKEYKRNTWVTRYNLPSLLIGAAEQLAWPLLINVMIKIYTKFDFCISCTGHPDTLCLLFTQPCTTYCNNLHAWICFCKQALFFLLKNFLVSHQLMNVLARILYTHAAITMSLTQEWQNQETPLNSVPDHRIDPKLLILVLNRIWCWIRWAWDLKRQHNLIWHSVQQSSYCRYPVVGVADQCE